MRHTLTSIPTVSSFHMISYSYRTILVKDNHFRSCLEGWRWSTIERFRFRFRWLPTEDAVVNFLFGGVSACHCRHLGSCYIHNNLISLTRSKNESLRFLEDTFTTHNDEEKNVPLQQHSWDSVMTRLHSFSSSTSSSRRHRRRHLQTNEIRYQYAD
jgi:hypothetical protein